MYVFSETFFADIYMYMYIYIYIYIYVRKQFYHLITYWAERLTRKHH